MSALLWFALAALLVVGSWVVWFKHRPHRADGPKLGKLAHQFTMFGLPGSYICLTNLFEFVCIWKEECRERYRFTVVSERWDAGFMPRLADALALASAPARIDPDSVLVDRSAIRGTIITERQLEPVDVERVMRVFIRLLRGRSDVWYQMYFDGPKDHAAIAAYVDSFRGR